MLGSEGRFDLCHLLLGSCLLAQCGFDLLLKRIKLKLQPTIHSEGSIAFSVCALHFLHRCSFTL